MDGKTEGWTVIWSRWRKWVEERESNYAANNLQNPPTSLGFHGKYVLAPKITTNRFHLQRGEGEMKKTRLIFAR